MNTILIKCVENGETHRATEVFRNMRKQAIWAPENFHQLGVWGKLSNWYITKFDGGIINRIFRFSFADYSSRTKKSNRVKTVSETRINRWPLPNEQTYSVMIEAYMKNGDNDHVITTYKEMKVRFCLNPSDAIRLIIFLLKRQVDISDIVTIGLIVRALNYSPLAVDLVREKFPLYMPPHDIFFHNRDLLRHDLFSHPVTCDGMIFCNTLDMHGMTKPVAYVCLFAYMEAVGIALLEQDRQRASKNLKPVVRRTHKELNILRIITGRGIGGMRTNRRGPVLRQFVEEILLKQNIPSFIPPHNDGMIEIRLDDLRSFARLKQEERNKKQGLNDITIFKLLAGATTLSSLMVSPFIFLG